MGAAIARCVVHHVWVEVGSLVCRMCGSTLFWDGAWVVCSGGGGGGPCSPVCSVCGAEMRHQGSRADKSIYDRSCDCSGPPLVDYETSAAEVERMRQWFSDHGERVIEEVARSALWSVAKVRAGEAARAEFEGRDGRVATVTPEDACWILEAPHGA